MHKDNQMDFYSVNVFIEINCLYAVMCLSNIWSDADIVGIGMKSRQVGVVLS